MEVSGEGLRKGGEEKGVTRPSFQVYNGEGEELDYVSTQAKTLFSHDLRVRLSLALSRGDLLASASSKMNVLSPVRLMSVSAAVVALLRP